MLGAVSRELKLWMGDWRLAYEPEDEAEQQCPQAEAGVPAVVVTDEHHAQEHEDDGVAGGAGGTSGNGDGSRTSLAGQRRRRPTRHRLPFIVPDMYVRPVTQRR